MKWTATRTLLALVCTIAGLRSSVSANDLGFSDTGKTWTPLRQRTDAISGQPRGSFLSDTAAGTSELAPPSDLADLPSNEPCPCDKGGNSAACGCSNCDGQETHGVYFAEVQLMWLRAHVMENAIGKLSETYELSPRFIIGYEDKGGIGGRIRYWHYSGQTSNLTAPADALRFEFDVIDLEGTSRFGTERTELVVAGGFRWADLQIELGDAPVANDMPGITFAADLRTIICRDRHWEWASVGGARWSILGGDWEGSSSGFIEPNRDDNLTVTEIYGGFEYIQHYSGYDVYGRVAFEVQSWHSDAAGQTAGTDSIGFIGPGLHLGMIF